jgi:hypothetical protein
LEQVGKGFISVDTIKLMLGSCEYSLSDSPALRVWQQAPTNTRLKKGLLWRQQNGEWVRGYGASWGDGVVFVQLMPGLGLRADEPPRCFVTFSAPKVVFGHNLYAVDCDQLAAAFCAVEKTLRDIGIECDIMRAEISRLDLCRDVRVRRKVADYIPMLRLMHVPYQQGGKVFETTVSKLNKQRGTVFYDKFKQMKKRYPEWRRELPDAAILRTEHRLRNAGAVRRAFASAGNWPAKRRMTAARLVECYQIAPHIFLKHMGRIFRPDELARCRASSAYPHRLARHVPDCEALLRQLQEEQIEDVAASYPRKALAVLHQVEELEAAMNGAVLGTEGGSFSRTVHLNRLLHKRQRMSRSQQSKERRLATDVVRFAILKCGVPCVALIEELCAKLCASDLRLVAGTADLALDPVPQASLSESFDGELTDRQCA